MNPTATITLGSRSGRIGRPRKRDRMTYCDCGRKAVKVKWGSPVCAVCDDIERRGFVGGPYDKDQE